MLIYREDLENGEFIYKDEYDNEYDEVYFLLDDKPTTADVLRADTKEGWIEVELPEVKGSTEIGKANPLEQDHMAVMSSGGKAETKLPIIKMKTKRLNGKVRVMVPVIC
jgi:hypothetical protein